MDKWEYDQEVFSVRTERGIDLKGLDEDFLEDGWEVMATVPVTMTQTLQPNQGELEVRFRVTSVLVLFRRLKK